MNTTIPTIPLTPKEAPGFSTELNVWWDYKANGWMMPDVIAQDTWTLVVHKNITGSWVFSLPQFLTFNEALTNGTEKSLDVHYKNLTSFEPIEGNTMTLTVSSKELKDATTKLLHWQSDVMWTDANWFVDTVTDIDCWLCPYVQVLFKEVPETLWIHLSTK